MRVLLWSMTSLAKLTPGLQQGIEASSMRLERNDQESLAGWSGATSACVLFKSTPAILVVLLPALSGCTDATNDVNVAYIMLWPERAVQSSFQLNNAVCTYRSWGCMLARSCHKHQSGQHPHGKVIQHRAAFILIMTAFGRAVLHCRQSAV